MSSFTFDVFISYSHADAAWVKDWLLPRLESAGLRVCIDFRDFEIGAPSIVNMERAVQQSAKTLLVISPNWVKSEWAKFESLLLQTQDPAGKDRRLLLLMLEKCTMPARLGIFTYADFTIEANWETELKRLINSIRELPQQSDQQHLQPNLVHPYPLQANFTGRVKERNELTAWLADNSQPICALIAMGGMGKSALAWYWLKNDLLSTAQPPAAFKDTGVMWWSFYEGESSFAKFIDHALKYVTGKPIDMDSLPAPYDRAQELRSQLQHKRVLFILDGFERQLREYASLDAAYKQDATTETSREARACVDPLAARWLREITSGTTQAKVLLTTRLIASDLEDRAGYALAGVLKRALKELPREDAITFMKAQGVTTGTSAEIGNECEKYGYHPLSLRLLSGLIAHDAQMPGDIAAAARHDVHGDLIQRQHHILEQSYNALEKRERRLISCIAAFRSPMDYQALTIFNTFGHKAKFEVVLKDLLARGLLQHDTAKRRYDLHPIVRHYCYERLPDKKSVHTRLRDYFSKISVPDENKVKSIEDLAPLIELYHHTLHAGRYDEASELYRDRLNDLLFYRFGVYQIKIELLRALFPEGEDRLPKLNDESAQGWVMNSLAISYKVSGQPRRAIRILHVAIPIVEKLNEQGNIISGLVNIAYQHMLLGELVSTERNLRLAIKMSCETKAENGEVTGRQAFGHFLAFRGAFNEAESELKIAQGIINKFGPRGAGYGSIDHSYSALRALLMGDARQAVEEARQAHKLADEYAKAHFPIERLYILAGWLLGAAFVFEATDLNIAATYLTDALLRCRRINLVESEPDILLAWARWYRAKGDRQEAQSQAEEALAIAERCEFRLKQAEIHNFMARLAMDVGKREEAREHARIARERAWCDGPPHCYKPALDEADAMLKELGAEG